MAPCSISFPLVQRNQQTETGKGKLIYLTLAKTERRRTSKFLSAVPVAILQYIESQETKTRMCANVVARQVSPGYLHCPCCGLEL